jgi:colicin import membrane protein
MSLITTTTRTALKVARIPADIALGLIGRDSTPARSAQVAVDRVDAAARDTVGRVAGDRELQEEARLGSKAADERARAVDLEEVAAKKKADAEKRRKRAAKTADSYRAEADETARERKQEVGKQTAAERKRQQDREERERLEALKAEKRALDEREEALEAKDEAQRLEAAAGAAKAQRKNGS